MYSGNWVGIWVKVAKWIIYQQLENNPTDSINHTNAEYTDPIICQD